MLGWCQDVEGPGWSPAGGVVEWGGKGWQRLSAGGGEGGMHRQGSGGSDRLGQKKCL